MTELTFVILRLAFLLLLWIFIFGIVYALRSDLFGAPARRLRDRNTTPAEPNMAVVSPLVQAPQLGAQPQQLSAADATVNDLPSAGGAAPARCLLITSGVASGTEIPLDEEVLTIGRSPDSTLVIVDEYTSTHHAQLTRKGETWQLTDLDSTNGTKLDGQRISGTVSLPIFTAVTIGTTTFELRP